MNSATNPTDTNHEDSIDLMDTLLTLAENLRLLLLGPLLVGVLALGLAYLLPKKFESTAILKAESSFATYMVSSPVLDAALRNLGYLKDLSEDEADEVRSNLSRRVSASAARNDKLVTLKVQDRTPEAAQRMAQEILANTFANSKPKDAELKRLVSEKAILSQQAAELTSASKTAQRILERASASDNLGAVAESIASISSNLIKIQEGIHKVEQKEQGLTEDDLFQAPTLPKKSVAPNKPLIAVLASLATGLALLAYVLIRQAWRTSRSLQQHQERLDALKRRYGLGR